MKYLLVILVFVFQIASAAEQKTVDIDFRQVAIPEFSNAVLKGMLQTNYVLSSDVLSDARKVTVNVKGVSSDNVLAVYTNLLNGLGVDVIKKDGIIYVQKSVSESQLSPVTDSAIHNSGSGDSSLLPASGDKSTDLDLIFKHYIPKYRNITFLSKIVTFSGCKLAQTDDASGVLVYASHDEKLLDRLENMLLIADRPQSAITIKAALIEYSNSNDSSRSLSGALSLLAGKLGVVYSAGQSLANGITFKNKTLSAAISAIDGDSSFKYLSEPTIRVLNGEKARLIVGSDVPVRGNSTMDKNGNLIQSVDYKTSGVQFEVLPKIQGDNISLYINQQISNFALTTTSNIDSPTLFKRQAETTLDVKKGSLIMMAGLDESKAVDSSSGLFFLPKFLRSKSSSDSKSQILLLLEVVNDDENTKASL